MEKIKLVEKILVDISKENIEIFDKTILIESKDNKEYSCRGIIRNIPVTKYTENLNGRIYSKKLWEKVASNKFFESSPCYADHSEQEASVKDTAGIWKNFKINENTANADLYCVGSNGELLLEVISASGKAGFSTVGFGSFLEEESNVVDPDSYDYTNTDWVANPSQQVFATQENAKIEKTTENIKDITNKIDEKITNKKDEKLKEEVNSMDKYTELNFKNQIKTKLREAKRNENLKEAIDDLKEIEVPDEMVDIKQKIYNTMGELQTKLEEQKNNAEEQLETKTKDFDAVAKEVKELKEKYEKAKSILEKVGLGEDVDIEKLQENVQEMSEKIKAFEETEKEMLGDIAVIDKLFENKLSKKIGIKSPSDFITLVEDTFKRNNDIKVLLEDRKDMEDDISKYEKYLKENEKRIEQYEEELEKLGYIFEEEDEKKDDKEDDKEEKDDKEKDEKKGDKEEKKESVNKKYKFSFKEEEKEDDDKKDEKKDDKEKEDDKEDEDKKEEKKESEIKIYVDREISKNASVKDIEKEVLKSTSLREAIEKVQKFEEKKSDSKDDVINIKEGFTARKPGWLGNRD